MKAVPVLSALASAFPAPVAQTALWNGYFASHFESVRGARRVFFGAGITARHACANPIAEDLSQASTGQRMRRYRDEALPLAKEALQKALCRAGCRPDELGLLVVVSCTGFCSPGLDVLLGRDLGVGPSTRRLLLSYLGCHGALPGLSIIRDDLARFNQPAALCCVELSSLHVQPCNGELEQVATHALFSDAAAAAVVMPSDGARSGFQLLDRLERSDLAAAEHLTWEVTDRGFSMQLARDLPARVAPLAEPLVDELLQHNGLSRSDIASWAIHPGGPRVLEVVGQHLGLSFEQLFASTSVLAEHGNCSSSTILLVLERLADSEQLQPGDLVVALAFGPGLVAHGALLRRC